MKRVLSVVLCLGAFAALRAQAGTNQWTLTLDTPASIAIDPSDSSIAYAATAAGIYKTTDRGGRWTLVEAYPNANAIAVNPNNPANVVAGNSDLRWENTVSPLSYIRWSDDGGTTWQEVRPFVWEQSVATLVFDPSEPATVYAALHDSGVGKSTDGGKTWTLANSGLRCCAVDTWTTFDIAIGPGSAIYAASADLYKSIDRSESWQLVRGDFEVWTVSVDPTTVGRVFATGYVQPKGPAISATSADGGQHWVPFAPYVGRIAANPRLPTILYAPAAGVVAGPHGVLCSKDGGDSWSEFNVGLPRDLRVTSLVIDHTGSLLYASNSAGVFVYEVWSHRRRAVK